MSAWMIKYQLLFLSSTVSKLLSWSTTGHSTKNKVRSHYRVCPSLWHWQEKESFVLHKQILFSVYNNLTEGKGQKIYRLFFFLTMQSERKRENNNLTEVTVDFYYYYYDKAVEKERALPGEISACSLDDHSSRASPSLPHWFLFINMETW